MQYLLPVGKDRERIRDNFVQFLDGLDKAKAWEIEVEPLTKPRSNKQNRALWKLAYPALQEATGAGVNAWHEYMLGECFGWVEENLFGKRKLRPARTTTTDFDGKDNPLSTVEFAAFFEFIQRRAAQNGVFIPDPDPTWWKPDAKQE